MINRAGMEVLHASAAVLAVLVARRRADYRPVALFLAVTAVASLAGWAVSGFGGTPPVASAPAAGLGGLRDHAVHALYLVWPAGLVALVVRIYGQRSPWPVGLAYVAIVAGLVFLYPTLGESELRRVYLATHLAALAFGLAAIVRWSGRDLWPGLPHTATLILYFVELGATVVTYQTDFATGWRREQVICSTVYAILAAVEGRVLWRMSASSR